MESGGTVQAVCRSVIVIDGDRRTGRHRREKRTEGDTVVLYTC